MLPRELNWSETLRRFVCSQLEERSVEDELEEKEEETGMKTRPCSHIKLSSLSGTKPSSVSSLTRVFVLLFLAKMAAAKKVNPSHK